MDKRNNHIGYTDDDHRYFNTKTNEDYISVTTLIGRYKVPFNEKYWSLWKALEAVIGKRKLKELLCTEDIYSIPEQYSKAKKAKIYATQKKLKAAWRDKRIKAARKGTKYHNEQEIKWKGKSNHKINDTIYKRGTTNLLAEHKNGIFAELLVYNDEYKIAGQIDLAIKKGNKIKLIDYKTNEKLKAKNKFQSMKPPVTHLDDCNLIHYQLQLNLYKWILEQQGYEVSEMVIYHVPTKEYIPIPKLQDEIKAILSDFRGA